MMPPAFEYMAPTDVDEAIDLLNRYGDDAKILAGGQSLRPLLKSRITSIPYLISLSEVKDMSDITDGRNSLKIGAMTLDADLEYSPTVRKNFPILSDALGQLADPLVRNMGTVGGNLSHGDPSNDLPSVMLALDATFKIRGKSGEREVHSRDFYMDTFVTALEHGEILTEISVPYWPAASGGAYVKFRKGTWNFSVAGVAVQLQLDNEIVKKAGIAITSMGPTALKASEAENYLKGKKLTAENVRHAAELVVAASQPSSDSYGSVEYKKEILRRISVQAIKKAQDRAEVK
jgi:Aerobic-type carbon monoxide dehydrogenase, middle subunit CoxM/CutM homologs